MAGTVSSFDPTNYRQVKARILKLLSEGLVIIPDSHAQPRMQQRKVDNVDVLYVIRTGRIVAHSKPGKHWRYVIEGLELSAPRRNIRCVVEINGFLVVITVIVLRR